MIVENCTVDRFTVLLAFWVNKQNKVHGDHLHQQLFTGYFSCDDNNFIRFDCVLVTVDKTLGILTPSRCVFCSAHLALAPLRDSQLLKDKEGMTSLFCWSGLLVCLVFLGQQGDYYCRKSSGCCWWCQIIMHKQTNLRKKVRCQGSLAMLEVNSYRLLTESSFILS